MYLSIPKIKDINTVKVHLKQYDTSLCRRHHFWRPPMFPCVVLFVVWPCLPVRFFISRVLCLVIVLMVSVDAQNGFCLLAMQCYTIFTMSYLHKLPGLINIASSLSSFYANFGNRCLWLYQDHGSLLIDFISASCGSKYYMDVLSSLPSSLHHDHNMYKLASPHK